MQRARRRCFVGRADELGLFREAVEGAEPPFSVLFVHGPGGVGKTALLERFAEVASGAGMDTVRVDLSGIAPTPAAVLAELAAALGLPDGTPPLEALSAGPRRVLLLDTYEAAAPTDAWIRERFLPALAAGTLVVIAGRNPPAPEWLADPGWRELRRVVSLRNLPPDDVGAYLGDQGIPERLHERAFELTHGHPLALSLISELVSQRDADPEAALPPGLGDAPDLVATLLQSFLEEVPTLGHRQALQVCAHARFTTEHLLREALDGDEATELFGWLRALSFIEETAQGIFPHDLARDVLEADLRWRDAAAYEDLHRRVHADVVRRVREADGLERQRAATDYVFLQRTNPFTAAFIEWKSYGSVYYDLLRPGDREPILKMAALHEGSESSELVAHWLDRQPESFWVLRAGGTQPLGFAGILALHEASEADIAADPGTAAMWAYAQSHGPPRPGEEVFASRFYVDRETYQGASASYSAIAGAWVEHVFSSSRPSWEFIGFWADPDRIEPFMSFIDHHRVPEADFEVGGRRYGVFVHDWRQRSLDEWIELGDHRQIDAGFDPLATPGPTPIVALSAPEFATAVRDALRNLHRPEVFAANPLLHSRVVRDRAATASSVEALQEVVEEAVGTLRVDPRDEKLYRVLARTYLRPARTQERAAEALDLPFSTYKRHLKRGIERVTAWLWQRELYGDGS